jgi:hypothetical protein
LNPFQRASSWSMDNLKVLTVLPIILSSHMYIPGQIVGVYHVLFFVDGSCQIEKIVFTGRQISECIIFDKNLVILVL